MTLASSRITINDLPDIAQGLFDRLSYTPTNGQLPIFMHNGRFVLVTGGQQSGKTDYTVHKFPIRWNMDMMKWQPCASPLTATGESPEKCGGHPEPEWSHLVNHRCDPTLRYWLVGSEYVMCEEEYNRIYQDLVYLGQDPRHSARVDAPGYIEVVLPEEDLPRLRIDVKSESRPDRAFSRVSPHGIICCEAGQLSYQTYQLVNSRTIGKQGWLDLVGTIEKSQPWFPAMSEAWTMESEGKKSFQLPTWSNNFLFPGGENDPEILRMKAENPDDFYLERIAGKSVPPEGLRFKQFNIGVHVNEDVQYIPGEDVYIFVDPGYQRGKSAYAVEVYHKIAGQYRGFAEFHEHETIHKDVIHWCTQQEWWKENKYLSIDPFYKDSHPANKSPAEVWREEAGLVTAATNVRASVQAQDDRLDQYLHINPITGQPGIVWSPSCTGILSEFGAIPNPHSPHAEIQAYRWRVGDGGNNIGARPISEHCDGIRATEAGLIDNEGLPNRSMRRGVTHRGGKKLPGRSHEKELRDRILGKA